MLGALKQEWGYLCHKTITPKNVPSEAQVKNFFVSQKSYVLLSRYSSLCIFNNPKIYRGCIWYSWMSISTWDSVHSWIYLLNHNSLTIKLGQMIDITKGKIFSEIFWTIWTTGAVPGPFQFSNMLQLLNNQYVKFPVLHFLEMMNKGELKMINTTTKIWQISLYCHFNKIIKGPGTSFQSIALSQKHVRNVCYEIH